MGSQLPLYTASPEDRSFPVAIGPEGQHEYVGELEPNYWCRGWNAKRQKYCKARAGSKTDHPGIGRCTNHGGATPITSGRYSRITRQKLRTLIEELEDDPDPLDLFPELATARALFIDWINRYDDFTEALLLWYESQEEGGGPRKIYDIADGYKLLDLIRKVVASIEKIASENAISRPELLRVMTEMGRVVESNVDDPDVLEKIKHGWGTIRVG